MTAAAPAHVLAAFRLGERPVVREVAPGTFAATLAGAELARAARVDDGLRYWRDAHTGRQSGDLATLLADAAAYRVGIGRNTFDATGFWSAVELAARRAPGSEEWP